jgi:hypothetical protein
MGHTCGRVGRIAQRETRASASIPLLEPLLDVPVVLDSLASTSVVDVSPPLATTSGPHAPATIATAISSRSTTSP